MNGKISKLLILFLGLSLIFAGCTPTAPKGEEDPVGEPMVTINIGALKGPTALGMLKLMQDAQDGETKGEYNFTLAGAPDEISAKLISGELNMAAVPANLASVLFHKTKGQIRLLAINTLGVLYVLETGEEIETVADLAGKTIYATGMGSTPEFALNYILRENGLEPNQDVEIVYKNEHAEVAALMAEGKVDIALLPQPFVTTVLNKDIARVALDMTEEWQKIAPEGSNLVMGALAINDEFYQENQDAVNDFLTEYAASVKFTNENVDEAAALSGAFDVIAEPVAQKAIPACNIVYYDGEEMMEMLEPFFQVLYEADPKSIGGELPDLEIYIR